MERLGQTITLPYLRSLNEFNQYAGTQYARPCIAASCVCG
jgi:hypothetical protein